MTVTTNGTGEAATISTAAAQARLEQMAAEVQGQLDEARQQRDQILQTLKEHDQLVERLQVAVKALAGPVPREARKVNQPAKQASRELQQLVEAALFKGSVPMTVTEVAGQFPHRANSAIRTAIYSLRDTGRIRVAGVGGERGAKTYTLMPEVAAEHAG